MGCNVGAVDGTEDVDGDGVGLVVGGGLVGVLDGDYDDDRLGSDDGSAQLSRLHWMIVASLFF